VSEPEGRGAAWTEERRRSDEGRRHLRAPRRRANQVTLSSRARQLITAGLIALVTAILTGHAGLILLAAPVLVAAAVLSRARPATDPVVTAAMSGTRCFEGEDVELTVTASCQGADSVTVAFEPCPQVTAVGGEEHWVLRAKRWGRYSPGTVRVTCRCGAWETSRVIAVDPVEVFPRAERVRPRLVPAELLRRIGEHTGRAVGEGVEFAGIRPYVPGDQLRDLNRPVSIRRGAPHVNQRAAARAADLVVMIDAFGDVGTPGNSTLDLGAHGAAALAAAYLRVGDRVGLVVLGGVLRWIGPAPGDRHFYRIAEMMLRARYDSYVTPDIGRIPRTALPPGTLIVVFSPLLDRGALDAIADLRQRGFPLIVVDTLRHSPPVARSRRIAVRPRRIAVRSRGTAARPGSPATDELAVRVWRLERAATRVELAAIGVPVLHWAVGAELDGLIVPVARAAPRVRVAARP
jgi:uncharacterized protein (DUF58 family)